MEIFKTVDQNGYNNLISDWQSASPTMNICLIIKLNSMNTTNYPNFNIDYEIQYAPKNIVTTYQSYDQTNTWTDNK